MKLRTSCDQFESRVMMTISNQQRFFLSGLNSLIQTTRKEILKKTAYCLTGYCIVGALKHSIMDLPLLYTINFEIRLCYLYIFRVINNLNKTN